MTGTITTEAINTKDWYRIGTNYNGLYNWVAGKGIAIDADGPKIYPSGEIIMGRNTTETISGKTHSGHFSMSGGYIFGSYINMTADVAGGSPVYVAGQNGDNYLRRYPKSVVATTTSAGVGPGNIDLYDGNGWVEVGRLTTPRAGQAHISAMYHVQRANGTYVSQAYAQIRLHMHGWQYVHGSLKAGYPMVATTETVRSWCIGWARSTPGRSWPLKPSALRAAATSCAWSTAI